MRRLLSVGLAIGLLAPIAHAATKPGTHTKQGMATARRLLLTSTAFPRGWTSAAAGKTVPVLACSVFVPSTTGILERGAASSPSFRAGGTGPFVTEAVYVYATARQASTFWRRVARPGIARCLAQSVTQGSTKDVSFKVIRRETLAPPSVGARSAAYRVAATASTPGQTATAYFDLLLVGHGAAIAALSVSGFTDPVSPQLETSLARAAARKLQSG
jgi:hypothetical protein